MNTTLQQLLTIRALFDEAERRGILLWLESGWAIDARLGKITRAHEDIDIAFAQNQEGAYRELIRTLGFNEVEEMDYGFLAWREAVLLDSEPCVEINGSYGFEGFPVGSCPVEKQGVIEGNAIRCLSWEAIYFEFLGYMDEVPQQQWRDKDLQSLQLIEAHLSLEKRQAMQALYASGQQRSF
jgi:2''-aminoglycoside nucleotidyltransferase